MDLVRLRLDRDDVDHRGPGGGASLVRRRIRRQQTGDDHRCRHRDRLEEPAHLFLRRRHRHGRQGRELEVRGLPATVLNRLGWKKDQTMKPGDRITVTGWRARDGSNWAHSREITLTDGRKLMFGPPAGTGDGGR